MHIGVIERVATLPLSAREASRKCRAGAHAESETEHPPLDDRSDPAAGAVMCDCSATPARQGARPPSAGGWRLLCHSETHQSAPLSPSHRGADPGDPSLVGFY